MQCLILGGISNSSFLRNRFQNCGHYNIFVSDGSPTQSTSGLTFQNNFFGKLCEDQVIGVNDCIRLGSLVFSCQSSPSTLSGLNVSYNTFDGHPPSWNPPSGGCAYVRDASFFVGNLLRGGFSEASHCDPAKQKNALGGWEHNVIEIVGTGVACSGDTTGIAAFISPDPPDYDRHIGPTSSAIAVVPQDAAVPPPLIDIDGDLRPTSGNVDAGADER